MAEIMPIVVNGGMGIWKLQELNASPLVERTWVSNPSKSAGLPYRLSWTPEFGIMNGKNSGIRYEPDSVDYPGKSGLMV